MDNDLRLTSEILAEERLKEKQEIIKLKEQVLFFENELERERMRLAACGIVALANTVESAKTNRKMLQEYRSGSLQCIESMVDENIRLRKENKELRKRPKNDLSTVQGREQQVIDNLPDCLKTQAV